MLTGPGGELGDALVADPRVRKVSFTGSTAVGEHIARVAGVKKLSLELGASCPVVILPDADVEAAASAVAARRLHQRGPGVHLRPARASPTRGASATSSTRSCPRSRRSAPATRSARTPARHADHRGRGPSESRRRSATPSTAGRELLTGGEREGAVVTPAVVADVDPPLA